MKSEIRDPEYIREEQPVGAPRAGFTHSVQFYEDDAFLAESVASFVGEGLMRGGTAISIATPEHWCAIVAELESHGIDVGAAILSQRLQVLDASDTLDKILTDGVPNSARLAEVFVPIIDKALLHGNEVRVFGEMVALLWERGNEVGTHMLEREWELLGEKMPVSLLCAYPMRSFANSRHASAFRKICSSHTSVLPSSQVNIDAAEDGVTIAELEQRASSLDAEIESRQLAEETLRHTRDELAIFVETATLGISWTGPDGKILWANTAELKMLGYSREEYVGRNIADFHVDRETVENLYARLRNGETVQGLEGRLKGKDGSIKIVQIDSGALWNGGEIVRLQTFTRDVTHEVLAMSAQNHYAAIVESSEDAIIGKNLAGIITSWNRAAESIFGYTAAEAIGKPVTILIPEERRIEEREILGRIRRGERISHYETVRRRKDGALLDISLTVSPIRNPLGQIVGASKIARDISAQKRDQRALQELATELARTRIELEQRVQDRTASLRNAVEQMEEFSYTVSHDLRAPLRAMNMYSRVIIEDYGTALEQHPEAIVYLNRIADNCSRLDRMITDVLTVGKVARDELSLKPVSLDEAVAEVIRHHPKLQSPHAELQIEILGEVIGHEPSVIQALSNLLTNAIKFVPEGRLPVVRLWTERGAERVRVWVEDNGIGIHPKYQHRLFSLFERVHPHLSYEGTGVGLAIVRKAIERMGGSVGVESDGSSGSRFWIELPAP